MVKVSSIVVAHNCESTIRRCIDSIINQSIDSCEIIVINNGSTDHTKEILDGYKKKIKVINQTKKSIGYAYNEGIKNCEGEYITFINSNDYILKDMFDNYYKYATENNLELVTGNYSKVLNGKTTENEFVKYKIGNVKTSPQIIFSIEYCLDAKLFKREMILNNSILFPENKNYGEISFICLALLKSKLVGQIKDSYYYSVISKIDKNNNDENIFDIFDILNIIIKNYKKEFYLKNEIDYLIINKVMEFMLKPTDKNQRKKFINSGYNFLNNNIKNWKLNKYYKKTSLSKRIINNHKTLLKGYLWKI